MTEKRLNNCFIVHVDKHISDELDIQEIAGYKTSKCDFSMIIQQIEPRNPSLQSHVNEYVS